jgi:hypothetical protein
MHSLASSFPVSEISNYRNGASEGLLAARVSSPASGVMSFAAAAHRLAVLPGQNAGHGPPETGDGSGVGREAGPSGPRRQVRFVSAERSRATSVQEFTGAFERGAHSHS